MTINKDTTPREVLIELFENGVTKKEALEGKAVKEIDGMEVAVYLSSENMPYLLYVEVHNMTTGKLLMNKEIRDYQVKEAYRAHTRKWRLPTYAELVAIHGGSTEDKFMEPFEGVVWTSDQYRSTPDKVWVVSMKHGGRAASNLVAELQVIPIRSTRVYGVLEMAPVISDVMTWSDARDYVDGLELDQDGTIELAFNGLSLRRLQKCKR